MNRLKELRENRCLTTAQLGNIVGVTGSTITNWEKEKRKINTKKLIKLAEYFNCSIDYLLCNTEKRNAAIEKIGELEEIKDLIEWFNYKANEITKKYKYR